jgi:hypothetical protein
MGKSVATCPVAARFLPIGTASAGATMYARGVAGIKSRVIALVACLGLSLAAARSARADAAPPGNMSPGTPSAQRLRAFFSGHSLLDDPLPSWVESIAASRGDSLGWQMQIVLGSPLRVRTKGNEPKASAFSGYQLGKSKTAGPIDVLHELAMPTQLGPGEKYDRLVITERNDLLGTIEWENTIGYLRDYDDRVVQQNPHASTWLYQVWPDVDKKELTAWMAYTQKELFGWECVAARVNRGLERDHRSDRVSIIPGGIALAELVKRALAGSVPGVSGSPSERADAIFADYVHLRPLGIYLIAAVQYAALFGKSPVGAAIPSAVSPAAGALLQQLAWDTVSSYRERAAHPPTLAECSARFTQELCPAYYEYHGRPGSLSRCKLWSEPDNPFAEGPSHAATPVKAFVGWGSGVAAFVLFGVGYFWQRRASRVSIEPDARG